MPTIRRILVPTDFSPTAQHAADYAAELARQLDASLTLYNVYALPVTIPVFDGSAFIPTPEAITELAAASQQGLLEERQRLAGAGVAVEITSADGVARDLIPRMAMEGGYDLVVMGTHGRTGLRHLVLGSVAEAVVRSSPCPVLTVGPERAHAATQPTV